MDLRNSKLRAISKQRDAYEETLQKELDAILKTKQENHSNEQQFYAQKLKRQQESSEFLANDLVSKEMKIQHILLVRKNVIAAFREFYQSTGTADIDSKTKDLLDFQNGRTGSGIDPPMGSGISNIITKL